MDDHEQRKRERAQLDAELEAHGMSAAARERWWTAHNGWIGAKPADFLALGRVEEVRRAIDGLRSYG